MTAPLKAIETSYAGCRFRSRLEARWAVFFDALGIGWRYEVQGYECARRLGLSGPRDTVFRYLPDFWLPSLGVHAEVKGTLDPDGYVRLLDAAACFGNLLICGEIPARMKMPGIPCSVTVKSPTWLRLRGDGIYASTWPDEVPALAPSTADCELANGTTGLTRPPEVGIRWLLTGSTNICLEGSAEIRAFDAARSARFEHGQSGAYLGQPGPSLPPAQVPQQSQPDRTLEENLAAGAKARERKVQALEILHDGWGLPPGTWPGATLLSTEAGQAWLAAQYERYQVPVEVIQQVRLGNLASVAADPACPGDLKIMLKLMDIATGGLPAMSP